jgi:hypothetical protein
VSKARCVQSLREDFTAFTTAFAPAFPAALTSADASTAAAFPAIPASTFVSAG